MLIFYFKKIRYKYEYENLMLNNSKIIYFVILVILIVLTVINFFVEPEISEVTEIILNKDLNLN